MFLARWNVSEAVRKHTRRSFDLMTRSRIPKAIAEAKKAVALEPTFGEAHIALAAALSQTDNWENALAELREGARLGVTGDVPLSATGDMIMLALLGRKQYAEALFVYQECERSGLISADMINSKGRCLWMLGKYEEALTAFKQAVKIAPTDPMNWWGLADMAQKFGDVDSVETASRELKKLLAENRDESEASTIREALEAVNETLENLRS